jgi:hypothetical protein
MPRVAATPLAVLAFASLASAQQDPNAVYQKQGNQAFKFTGDSTARYQWTTAIPDVSDKDNNYFIQARPRLEMTFGPVQIGVGGAFNYSDDENDVGPDGLEPAIIRENYRSRDARLDLAWGKLTLGPVMVEGGRFFMPIPFTEMIWDRDLRPQGGAAKVTLGGAQSQARLALYGIYATSSHVFEDNSQMYGGAAEITLGRPGEASLDVTGAYLEFADLNKLEPAIRRQNTRVGVDGLIVGDYKVVDIVGRLSKGGQVPTQLVFDYCWNTAIDTNNHGLWLAAILGQIGISPAQLEYTYSKIDRNATVAAFNTDDFLWGTGWEGHRIDLGVSTHKNNSIHGIVQWQRFKDAADPVLADAWVERYRVELRTKF